jgi:hypothetical protein
VSRVGQLAGLIPRAPQVLRTLRHVRPAQARAQLQHMLRGLPAPIRLDGPTPKLATPFARTAFLPPPEHVHGDSSRIEVLGMPMELGERVEWDSKAQGPLFAYHLHQQEYLRLASFDADSRAHRIRDWIQSHPAGTGWDPHPISLRLLCWGKLLLTPDGLPDEASFRAEVLRSMADQVATLVAGLEVRLQANHLLSNLLSIVWGGLLVDNEESVGWRGHASLLVDELDAQIHPDGGHEERSPMYHSLLLENILDLFNVCSATPGRAPAGLGDALESTAARMLDALDVLTHADGQIALFADSALGIAATPTALADYARRLGIQPLASQEGGQASRAGHNSALLPQTGYLRLVSVDFDLIASVAAPAPAHQPGHAHCDALSFELSIRGQRLITDTGLYEYLPGERRNLARTTASHSTIQIDGSEQAEVWAAHRVGGRPDVNILAWESSGAAEASCKGWSNGSPLHRRLFRVDGSGAELQDRIEGTCQEVVSRLYFAPEWTVGLERVGDDLGDGTAPGWVATARDLEGASPAVRIELPASFEWAVEFAPYYPSFGCEKSRPALVGRSSTARESIIRFSVADSLSDSRKVRDL